MKQIIIEKKNGPSIILTDDDNSEISTYTKKCSKLLDLSTISIIETSSSCVVVRPNDISSIQISEINNELNTIEKPDVPTPKGPIETEDIITDDEDIITDGE